MNEQRVFLVKTCGHSVDVTTWAEQSCPPIGEQVPCWSSCDNVPHWGGRDEDNPRMRRVSHYETHEVS